MDCPYADVCFSRQFRVKYKKCGFMGAGTVLQCPRYKRYGEQKAPIPKSIKHSDATQLSFEDIKEKS